MMDALGAATMWTLALIAGLILILLVLRDAFETMVLPRRLHGRLRYTRLFYRTTWRLWAAILGGRGSLSRRESVLSMFGPLSLLALITTWGLGLILGFALIYRGLGAVMFRGLPNGFAVDLYASGTTFVTLGLDISPAGFWPRLLTIVEGGMGLGFLALVIGYLPVLYQAFSAREANIAMLDARAGSPPTASELLRRHADDHHLERLFTYLAEWERWSAVLLESQISFPVLGYFRSQHVNQSWLAALTAVLDACALVMSAQEGPCARQARLTFAMARHAVVDLAQPLVHRLPPSVDRLPPEELARLVSLLHKAGFPLELNEERRQRLTRLRRLYEPEVVAIGAYLRLDIPPWCGDPRAADNWQRSPWERVGASAHQEAHF